MFVEINKYKNIKLNNIGQALPAIKIIPESHKINNYVGFLYLLKHIFNKLS